MAARDGEGRSGRFTPRASSSDETPRSSYSPTVRLVAALVLIALVLAPLAFVLIF